MNNRLDIILTKILGLRVMGGLDYLSKPKLKHKFGGPFNGQEYRTLVYEEIMRAIGAEAIVETGTFRGTTTALFVGSGLPVHSAEANPRYYSYSSMRFYRSKGQVRLFNLDSRFFLRRLASQKLCLEKTLFFYLDAHWEMDLPLREEVEIIFSTWPKAVIMIDDFKVPGTSYTYDDYGSGKALTPEYLAPLSGLGFVMYFPARDASQETGKKRGCSVLCRDPVLVRELDNIESLRRAA